MSKPLRAGLFCRNSDKDLVEFAREQAESGGFRLLQRNIEYFLGAECERFDLVFVDANHLKCAEVVEAYAKREIPAEFPGYFNSFSEGVQWLESRLAEAGLKISEDFMFSADVFSPYAESNSSGWVWLTDDEKKSYCLMLSTYKFQSTGRWEFTPSNVHLS